MKFHLAAVLTLAFSLLSPSAEAAGAENSLSTAIFNPLFRTLTATVDDNLLNLPVISLDGNQQLTFSFDEIADDRSYLRARLIHCNADWNPSSLVESEYVDGFNEALIEDFGYSSNTFIRYVNYHFTIGENGLRPLVSGNYIWQVYPEDDPENIILQARFRVTENAAFVAGEYSGRTDAGFNDEWQQLRLIVTPGQIQGLNPYADLMISITQNDRPDTERTLLHPARVDGSKIIYEHQPELIFPAGNEYRRFETVRNNYPGMGVDSTRWEAPMYQAYLAPAYSRADREYTYDSTQRGRFKIDEYNSTDPDLGADYIMTRFTLDFPEVMDGDIYIEGDLALRDYSDFNRMKYDRESGLYRASIPLKQGSYNYQYVIKSRDDKQTGAYAAPIEGNYFQTVNEYNVYVYMRLPGSRADRLIGYATIIDQLINY